MKTLIIVGAGTEVVVKLVHAINRRFPSTWNLLGFLDDDERKWNTSFCGYPVLGGIVMVHTATYQDAYFLCFIYGGNIWTRLKVLERLEACERPFATLIHPDVDMESVTIGADCVVQAGTVLQTNVSVGDHCGVGPGCVIGHDVRIDHSAWIGPRVTLLGRVVVKQAATLGAGSVVKGDVTIGEQALVGMGAVVVEDVPPGATVMGNPARVINRAGLRRRHPY